MFLILQSRKVYVFDSISRKAYVFDSISRKVYVFDSISRKVCFRFHNND
jgi:hypothetical protein